jgi:hypothetical protein
MKRATEIQFLKIVTKDGRTLGHVFDLRSRGVPEHGVRHEDRVIDELVYGKMGLRERLGLKRVEVKTLAWASVIEIKKGKIVV